MPRPSPLSLMLAASLISVGCGETAALGATCNVDPDCPDPLICDVHSGLGTCQQDHGHDQVCRLYSVGLSESGEFVTASFVSADPVPPSQGENLWVLAFTDSDDAPLDDLDIVVTPTMPQAGIGSPIEAIVSPTGNPGEYQLAPIHLSTPGYWAIELEITDGDRSDALMFPFCV